MKKAKKGLAVAQDATTSSAAEAAKELSHRGHQDRIDMNDPTLSGADAVASALNAKG